MHRLRSRFFQSSGSSPRSAPYQRLTNQLSQVTTDSILPILSIVYEKVLLTQLNQHIENNQLLSTHQSGFQKGHCTISTCMKIKEDIVKAMNRGEITLAVMADFSKVFDTVDFETLIQKLHQLNLSKSSLKIFASYLSNRHRYVQIDDRAAFLVQCFLLSTCMT